MVRGCQARNFAGYYSDVYVTCNIYRDSLHVCMEHTYRALAHRILCYQEEFFQVVLVAGVAADNDLAECSLRPLVVRKIGGGTHSPRA